MKSVPHSMDDSKPPPSYHAAVHGCVDNNFGTCHSVPSAPYAEPSTLDHLSQIFGSHEQLQFYSPSRDPFKTSTATIQLQDTRGQPVMSTLYTSGPHVSQDGDSENMIQVGGITKFMDATGKTLLIGQQNGESLTVSSGDKMLGVVEDMLVKNLLGQVVFRVVNGRNQSKFVLVNGTEVGKISRNYQGLVSLSFAQNLDPQTKGLMLATGHMLYLRHYIETPHGRGQQARQRMHCYCFLAMLFVPPIITSIMYLILK